MLDEHIFNILFLVRCTYIYQILKFTFRKTFKRAFFEKDINMMSYYSYNFKLKS